LVQEGITARIKGDGCEMALGRRERSEGKKKKKKKKKERRS
jgi:hypothetical protein